MIERNADNMLSIGFVAANLGVSTSTLRKWEERYGHPRPLRSEGGSRWYRETDLVALRQAKRLLDQGIRANRVFADFTTLLAAVEDVRESTDRTTGEETAPLLGEYLALVHAHDLPALRARLQDDCDSHGPERFVETIAAPLMRLVGEGWACGEVDVYQEHATTMVVAGVLRQQLPDTAPGRAPVVVLTTPPGEQHALALDMVTATLTRAGAHCVNLGASLPLADLLEAVTAFRASIVGLSISSVSAGRLTRRFTEELRAGLSADTLLWIGGSGAPLMPRLPDGVRAFCDTREPCDLIREMTRQLRVNESE